MKVSTERIEGSQVILKIEADAEEMERSLQQAYRRLAAKTNVPGFRKGKAPRSMLERYLGRDALVEDAANHLIAETYDQAVREQGVEPIARPQVEILQIEPVSFKATVPVRPTVELGDYHQIKFTPEAVAVTEEEVIEAVEKLRYLRAPWDPVDRAAKFDDLLNIDVEGMVEGKAVISEKGGWYQLSPDMPSSFPGFAEKLDGAKKGEERVFTLPLPQDYGELAGKECNLKVLVNEIKQKNLPNLDDDFAKSLGWGIETVAPLREKVAADIKSEKERVARRKLGDKVVEAAVAVARIEYPDILVQDEIDHLIAQRRQYLGERESLEDYLKNTKKTEEEFRNELRPIAEDTVRRSLVLEKLSKLEKIEVSDAEVDAEVERLAQYSSDERIRQLFRSPSGWESVKRNLSVSKIVDRLIEIATKDEESKPSMAKEGGNENGNPT